MALAKTSVPCRPIVSVSARAGGVMSSFWSYSTRQYGRETDCGLTKVRFLASIICRNKWPTGDLEDAGAKEAGVVGVEISVAVERTIGEDAVVAIALECNVDVDGERDVRLGLAFLIR